MKSKTDKIKTLFAKGDHVVYPSHGVAVVEGIEEEEYDGTKLDVVVIKFSYINMEMRIPRTRAEGLGLRKVYSAAKMDKALEIFNTKKLNKKSMWARKAQEYKDKINTGEPHKLAEVIHVLSGVEDRSTRSLSELQLYQKALDKLAAEMAIIDSVDKNTALSKLKKIIQQD